MDQGTKSLPQTGEGLHGEHLGNVEPVRHGMREELFLPTATSVKTSPVETLPEAVSQQEVLADNEQLWNTWPAGRRQQ